MRDGTGKQPSRSQVTDATRPIRVHAGAPLPLLPSAEPCFALLCRRSPITKGARVEAVNAPSPVSEGDSSRFTPRPASRIAPISSRWLSPLQPVSRTLGKTEMRRLESRVSAGRAIFSSRVKLSRQRISLHDDLQCRGDAVELNLSLLFRLSTMVAWKKTSSR